MYRNGDRVLYGVHGICNVVGMEVKTVDRRQREYYVLEPVEQLGVRYYVPTQNPTAVAKMRPIITKEELRNLLSSCDVHKDAWLSDENARKQRYRELITSGDRAELLKMVHALYRHKEEQLAAGKKFHLCDENFLKDAQKLLESEFSLVLNMEKSQVADYIKSILTSV